MTRPMRAASAALLILAATAALLFLMGRPPICTCGQVDLWINAANSARTSQMLGDWYSPSHVIHGILFFAALWLVARRMPLERRFVIAMAVEAAWELVENSPWAIDRYRHGTIATGYTGDSILNTMSDIAMMAFGFWLARKLPVWASAATVVALEIAALVMVRDNLTLNVWMFVWPNDAVKAWQSSGALWPFP